VKNILFICCLLPFLLNAQILDNKQGLAFTDQPFFDQNFIHTNKIKRLKGEVTVKKAGDMMRKTELKSIYEFNSLGQVISTFETRNEDGIKDTVQNLYEYSADNQLNIHRKKDANGYGSTYYQRDPLNRIVMEESRRELFDDKGHLERSLVINQETMKYDTFPLHVKKTVYNSYKLPYLEEISRYNADGYLLEKEESLKMTSGKVKYLYSYNEKGLISAIRSNAKVDGLFAEEWLFKYDDLGNLVEKHIFKNGVFTTDIQIIYNTDTKLLSSVLTREVSTNFIVIVRFLGYEYFD
jgi:hypothetical protein